MGYIYKITNKINNKSYIGLTTKTPEERWKQHIRTAYSPNSKDYNELFKKAIRKYGPENFEISVLDNSDDLEELKQKEVYWIKQLNTYAFAPNGYGYNSTIGGDAPTKPTVSVSRINILTGEVVETFSSIKEAEQVYKRGIHEIVHNQIAGQKPKGFTWVKTEDITNFDITDCYNRYGVFCQLDTQGNLIELWLNTTDAAESVKCSRGNISSCLSGNRKVASGYQWCYYKDLKNRENREYKKNTNGKKVGQYDLCDNLIKIWDSATEASKATGTAISKISAVCHGKRKTSNGFKWKYLS